MNICYWEISNVLAPCSVFDLYFVVKFKCQVIIAVISVLSVRFLLFQHIYNLFWRIVSNSLLNKLIQK